MPFPGYRASLMDDTWLAPYYPAIRKRSANAHAKVDILAKASGGVFRDFACAHEYYGLHRIHTGWVFREWAPNAQRIWLVGDFSNWQRTDDFEVKRISETGTFELQIPTDAMAHEQYYRLEITWDGGEGERIPAYARRVVQDPQTNLFAAQIWQPTKPYIWQYPDYTVPCKTPLIYEAHVGMAQEADVVSSYADFTKMTLPRIKDAGYNVIQLMAITEHPYYGSFGYHVSSFFAASSRFGTPEDLKALVDAAHGMGISVIMDIVHSHSVKNERDGLSCFDGTQYQYFHDGAKGWHSAWDSRCFNYAKDEVLHFLLSNCRYWLDEFHFDGYRFDGVTSMLYDHHGLGVDFVDYSMYFGDSVDGDAVTYLTLANRLIHEIRPDALTIAEDVSGMPGVGTPIDGLGIGFDYRMSMGVPECWFKLVKTCPDEQWPMGVLWHEMTNHRADERIVSYVESHDQALVGGKSFIFEMIDKEMYHSMHRDSNNLTVNRGIALHKMARLMTVTTGNAYLNFIGNEFGHPEWIDFPREGNNYSCYYARRQWRLRNDPNLYYKGLGDFDQAMIAEVNHGVLDDTVPRLLLSQDNDKILAYMRGNDLLIFNFHPTNSYVDYELIVPPGNYKGILDTDSDAFGGFGRIAPHQGYPMITVMRGNERCFAIRLYLPAHTALVIRREMQSYRP